MQGWTPLMYACKNGHLDVALTLLRAGVRRCSLEHKDHEVCFSTAYSALFTSVLALRFMYASAQYDSTVKA